MARFYTSREVEELFRVSPVTLQRWRKLKLIPFRKVTSRKILYPQKEVEEFLSEDSLGETKRTECVAQNGGNIR